LGGALLLLGLVGCDLQRPGEGDITQAVPDVAATAGQEGFAPPEAAQPGNSIIRVQPAIQQLNVGAVATTEIQITNVTDLAEASIELHFNQAVLQVQDADPNIEGVQIQPGNFLQPNFAVINEADNSTGVIRYTHNQAAETPPVSGEGVLASVNFQAINPGSSDLTFALAELASSAPAAIPVTSQGGQIIVTQPGQPAVEPTLPPGPAIEPTLVPTAPATLPPTPLPTDTPTAQPTLPPPPPVPTATLPPFAEIPPGATFGFCYRVRPGEESIYFLAQKFGTTPYAINLVNDLHPPSYIFTHQILFMPSQLGHGPNVYIIQAGDTLTSIAAECHLTPEMIIRRNKLDPEIDPDAPLPEGQGLKIPIPYFPPPSRFPYPCGPIPVVKLPYPCR
jgi:hypothetical protein